MIQEKSESTLPTIFGSSSEPIYILSPHLDDAVWSLGGLIRLLVSKKCEVCIITVFSRSAYVYGELRSPDNATSLRKAENSLALTTLGVKQDLCLDLSEGVLRDKSLEDIFDSTYEPPEHHIYVINDRLQKLLPSNARVLAPSAFGDNIDHITIRSVASTLPHQVLYYEDIPYVARETCVETARNFLRNKKCQEYRIHASDSVIEDHLALYALYISQRKEHHVVQIKEHLMKKGYGLWVQQ